MSKLRTPVAVRTLMEKIGSIEISRPEKERISRALADTESLAARVLKNKAPTIRDAQFWSWRQQQFRVTGFRPGTPEAIQRVISRALAAARAHVNGEQHADWSRIWRLYERCALSYLRDDQPELIRLLNAEEFHESGGSVTEQVFRDIAKALPIYEASLEQARELYEIFWFERTESFEQILSSASLGADAIRRLIDAKSEGLIDEARSEIKVARHDLTRQIEQQARLLESLKSELASLRADSVRSSTAATRPTGSAGAAGRIAHVEAVAAARSEAPSPSGIAHADLQRAVNIATALQSRVESMGKQLKVLGSRLDELGLQKALPVSAAQSAGESQSPANADHVIKAWSKTLNDLRLPTTCCGAAIQLEMIRRSRVILASKRELLTTLMAAVPGAECQTIAASPAWVGEADWKDGLAFLTEDVRTPRLLIVEEFNVGLQEAYLIPPIITWLSRFPSGRASRLALVPSGPELEGVSPRVLEFATLMMHDRPPVTTLPKTEMLKAPLSQEAQSALELLSYVESSSIANEDELLRYLKNIGVPTPPRVVRGFLNLGEGLRALVDLRVAREIAMEATLVAWAEHSRGKIVAQALRTALNQVNGD